MKKQISLRVSARTLEQIEQLKRIHGTATEAITVAINHYHSKILCDRDPWASWTPQKWNSSDEGT